MTPFDSEFQKCPVMLENGGTTIKVRTPSGTTSSTGTNGHAAKSAYWANGFVVVEWPNGPRTMYDRYWESSNYR